MYEKEMRERPLPRSVDSLRENARVWGDRCGFPAAEPFELLLQWRR